MGLLVISVEDILFHLPAGLLVNSSCMPMQKRQAAEALARAEKVIPVTSIMVRKKTMST